MLKRHKSPYWEFSPLEHEWEYRRRLAKAKERPDPRSRISSRHFGARRRKRRGDARKGDESIAQREALQRQHADAVAAAAEKGISQELRDSVVQKQRVIEGKLAELPADGADQGDAHDSENEDDLDSSSDLEDGDDGSAEQSQSKKRKSDPMSRFEPLSKRPKISASGSTDHSPEAADLSFDSLPRITKLRILASLVDWSHLTNKTISSALARSREFPRLPVGVDRWGNSYWYFDDHRLYCETPSTFRGPMSLRDKIRPAEWCVVAQSEPEWKSFVEAHKHARNEDEKRLVAVLEEDAVPWIQERLSDHQDLEHRRLAMLNRPASPSHGVEEAKSPSQSVKAEAAAAESEVLDPLAALAQASSALEQIPDSMRTTPHPPEVVKRKVGRPPKSARPAEPPPVDKRKEEVSPVELSASGRPIRSRHRTKFSDDFIEGDFAHVLNDNDGSDDDARHRRRQGSRRPSQPQRSQTPKASPSAVDSPRSTNPLSASTTAADTLHDIKQLFHTPAVVQSYPPPQDFQQLLLQQMALYQQYPAMMGMHYSPQQLQLYPSGFLAPPFTQSLVSPYFMPTLTSEQQSTLMARQNLISSSDMAAAALAQFQFPAPVLPHQHTSAFPSSTHASAVPSPVVMQETPLADSPAAGPAVPRAASPLAQNSPPLTLAEMPHSS